MKVPIVAFFKGFRQTTATMFTKPVTVEYPEEMREIPENWRGRIKVYLELCIGCTTCSLVCPNATCQMEYLDYAHPKNKRQIYPRVDVSSCIYCGLCEECCPTDAIRLDKELKLSEYDRAAFDYDTYELSKRESQLALERRAADDAKAQPGKGGEA